MEDDSEVFYQMSAAFHAAAARGARFDDPTFAIRWPLPVSVIAEREKALPLWNLCFDESEP